MSSPTPAPKLRADARRNRDALLDAARDAFAAGGDAVSLESVARAAGVGIGTLYRHFPTREALVESVYRAELTEVAASGVALAESLPADVALRTWMDRYARFVAAKHGMAAALQVSLVGGSFPLLHTRETVTGTVAQLLAAGVRQGVLRSDVVPDDVTATLVGIFVATAAATDDVQRGRMLDLVVDGLRTR